MKIAFAAFGSLVWLVVAPGTVCGLVPWLITGWQRPTDPNALVDVLGAVLVLGGSAVMLHSFVAFAWQGRGTPAPAAPTELLVVSGAYRFVRNPMYVAVVALVLGQVLLFTSWPLLAYLVADHRRHGRLRPHLRGADAPARPTVRRTTSSARRCLAGCRASRRGEARPTRRPG